LTATACGLIPAPSVVVTLCAEVGTALSTSTAHAMRATDSQTRTRRIKWNLLFDRTTAEFSLKDLTQEFGIAGISASTRES
jgi:hypothetical protein